MRWCPWLTVLRRVCGSGVLSDRCQSREDREWYLVLSAGTGMVVGAAPANLDRHAHEITIGADAAGLQMDVSKIDVGVVARVFEIARRRGWVEQRRIEHNGVIA